MEPRLIDATKLFDFLTEQLDKETGAYKKGRNVGLNIARSALHDEAITATIAPPPNDPLTLEELREMDGEPVYYVGCHGEHEWLIFRKLAEYAGIKMAFFNDRKSKAQADYGTMWTVYRRKPEEAQT